MTSVSLINPYAPQPATGLGADIGFAAVQSTVPINTATASGHSGTASDQSGQGAGNGTGTGGAHLATLLKRGRDAMPMPHPTSKSIVEAQSESDPATAFLERQARRQIEAKAAQEARIAQQAAQRADVAKDEAEKATLPAYVMPNPLPTAPILQREQT